MSRTNTSRTSVDESFEARWFTPTKSPVAPAVVAPLETRRGFRPPPPSSGLVFAGVSLVLVAVAVTGLVFYFTPADSKHERPVSTTTVTSSDAWKPEPAPATPPPAPVPVVTAKDLPAAPPTRSATPRRSPPVKATPRAAKGAPEFKIKN